MSRSSADPLDPRAAWHPASRPGHARPSPIAFLIGPSGAGKSTLAAWVAEDLGLLHLEIDRFPHGDGIDLEGLRPAWDAFWLDSDAQPLAAAVRERTEDANADGAILSFPSGVVPRDDQIAALACEDITLVVLYGSGAECLDAFLRREQAKSTRLDATHWIRHNAGPYASLSTPRFAPHRLLAFDEGGYRSRATLVNAIARRLQR